MTRDRILATNSVTVGKGRGLSDEDVIIPTVPMFPTESSCWCWTPERLADVWTRCQLVLGKGSHLFLPLNSMVKVLVFIASVCLRSDSPIEQANQTFPGVDDAIGVVGFHARSRGALRETSRSSTPRTPAVLFSKTTKGRKRRPGKHSRIAQRSISKPCSF